MEMRTTARLRRGEMRLSLQFGLLAILLLFAWGATVINDTRHFDTVITRVMAAFGRVESQFDLGYMYSMGAGVPQDLLQALHWYHKAAMQGDADAQFRLGQMYESGQGVQQDAAMAAGWYHSAAEQGNFGAQFKLGEMYDEGRGVPQDEMQAYAWYAVAFKYGHQRARGQRDRLVARFTPTQFVEAQKLANDYGSLIILKHR